jgi:hypothetical protein
MIVIRFQTFRAATDKKPACLEFWLYEDALLSAYRACLDLGLETEARNVLHNARTIYPDYAALFFSSGREV